MRSFISIIILEVYRVMAYFAGVVLILLLFSVTRISFAATPGDEFEVKLEDIYFEKVLFDNNIPGPVKKYWWSRFRDDMGQKGTFTEQQDHSGVYELIWAPPRDTLYINRDLYIKVVLSSKYSNPAEREIKSLEYIYLQDTDNPDKPEDLGIHTWVLKAKNIPARHIEYRLEFLAPGLEACKAITEYEMTNQGNPRFRSVERINKCRTTSRLTVNLDIGRKWWIPSPDITVTPRRMDFGRVSTVDSTYWDLTVGNVGDKTLSVVSSKIIGPEAVEFKGGPNQNLQIPPQSLMFFRMVYQPRHVGRSEAWLKIYSNDTDEPVVTVPLTGTGYDPVMSQLFLAPVYRILLNEKTQ